MFECETMSKKATSSYQQVKPWFFGKCVEIGFRWFYKRFSSSIDDRNGLFSPVIILHMHCDWGRFNEIWFSLRYYFTFSFPFFPLFSLAVCLFSLSKISTGERRIKRISTNGLFQQQNGNNIQLIIIPWLFLREPHEAFYVI